MIAVDARPQDLGRATLDAMEEPDREHRFLDSVSKHRDAAERESGGDQVKLVRDDELLHHALLLEAAGVRRSEVAARLGWTSEHLTKRLRAVKRALNIDSDVALGSWARTTGLLDDPPPRDLDEH